MKKLIFVLVTILTMITLSMPAIAENSTGNSEDLVLWIEHEGGYHLSDKDADYDVLNLNGKRMHVKGNFLHSGGTLILGNGTLIIDGNYDITSESGGICSSVLEMLDEGGHIIVNGDFTVDTTNGGKSAAEYLKAGTLEVKGNFKQKSSGTDRYGITGFATAGSHTVVLSGDGAQEVYFEDPGASYFTNLEITNQSGELKFNKLPIRGELIGDLISNYDIILNKSEFTLANQTIKTPNFRITDYNTMVKLEDGAVIDGNVFVQSGMVDLLGSAEITGDYIMNSGNNSYCSAGILKMTDEAGHLTVGGNFETDTNNGGVSGTEYLKAGTLEVKGDFAQKSTGTERYAVAGFATTGTHKVVLSGSGAQKVSIEDAASSCFTNLEVTNQSGFVEFGRVTIRGEVIGDVVSDYEIPVYNSQFTLSNQVIKTPNIILNDSNTVIKLEDGAVIDGSITVRHGMVDLLGRAEVAGDYIMNSGNNSNSSTGILKMTEEEGYLIVCGNFVADTTNDGVSGAEYLNAGVLEVKGDFNQFSTGTAKFVSEGFATTGTHKVILSGDSVQNVSFENPEYSYFTNLEITNQSGLVNLKKLALKGELIGNVISDYDILLYSCDITLADQIIRAPNVKIYDVKNVIRLADNAVIYGNFVEHYGVVEILGKATVVGDYTIPATSNSNATNAILKMQDEAGHLTIYGNFSTNTTNDGVSGAEYLKAGILELKGDFSQSSNGTAYYVTSGFATSGTHTVILSGEGTQMIRFEDPDRSYFTYLIVENPDGVVFATPYKYTDMKIVYPFDITFCEYFENLNQIRVSAKISQALKDFGGTFLFALYDEDGRLVESRMPESGGLETQIFRLKGEYRGGYTVKMFAWKGIGDISPICSAVSEIVE